MIADVLSEICSQNAHISVICLQEAPVKSDDIAVFVNSCLKHRNLHKFSQALQDPNVYTSWGLIALIDTNKYRYQLESLSVAKDKLKDRIQALQLEDGILGECRKIINLHFPYECKQIPSPC